MRFQALILGAFAVSLGNVLAEEPGGVYSSCLNAGQLAMTFDDG